MNDTLTQAQIADRIACLSREVRDCGRMARRFSETLPECARRYDEQAERAQRELDMLCRTAGNVREQ